jgi:hypothetical protein
MSEKEIHQMGSAGRCSNHRILGKEFRQIPVHSYGSNVVTKGRPQDFIC